MAKQEIERRQKYELVFEDEREIVTWKYDLSKFTNGPISVEIKSKYEPFAPKKKKKKEKNHFDRWV